MAPNLQQSCPQLSRDDISNLNKVPQAIPEIRAIKPLDVYLSKLSSSFCKNCYNSSVYASIWLKFGTHIGDLKSNNSIKFGVNAINIQGVISNFTCKAKSNFYQTYRLNCFEEQTENGCVARLNIRGVPFGG